MIRILPHCLRHRFCGRALVLHWQYDSAERGPAVIDGARTGCGNVPAMVEARHAESDLAELRDVLTGQGWGREKDVVAVVGGAAAVMGAGRQARGLWQGEGQCKVPFLGEIEDLGDELAGKGGRKA